MPRLRFNWPRNRVDQVLILAWIGLLAGLALLLAGIAIPSYGVKEVGSLLAGLGVAATLVVTLARPRRRRG